jgi:hypothetical protein
MSCADADCKQPVRGRPGLPGWGQAARTDRHGPSHASWVMGRSARWHDPDLRAEMAMQELAGRRAALSGLGGAAALAAALPADQDAVVLWVRLTAVLFRLVRRAAHELRRG